MYIFDLDGTIIDSNGLWLKVDEEFLGERGLTPTEEYEGVVARSIFPLAAEFTRAYYGLTETPEKIMAEWERLAARRYGQTVPLKEGALEFLEQCRAEGRTMALFTACRPVLCRMALERLELAGFFQHVVYAEEIGLEKHDPRCFLRLADLLGVPPEDCVLFDDSPANCATACRAGMEAVGVYDLFYHDRQEELRTACTRYVRSLAELVRGG